MTFQTADLCDEHEEKLQIAEPLFADLGGELRFGGQIVTLKLFEDNSRVREAVAEDGRGKVLVVDGGGSVLVAGPNRLELFIDDPADLFEHLFGVDARQCANIKRGLGDRDVPVRFAGVTFTPGHYLYADGDGIIVSAEPLLA